MKNNTKETFTAFRKTTLTFNEGWKREVNLFRTTKNLRLVSYRKKYSPFWKIYVELKNFKVNSTTSVFFHSRKVLSSSGSPFATRYLKLFWNFWLIAKQQHEQWQTLIERKIHSNFGKCSRKSHLKCRILCLLLNARASFWQLVKPKLAAAVSWRFLRVLNQGVSIQGWYHF